MICAFDATCSAPRCPTSPIPASRKASWLQRLRRKMDLIAGRPSPIFKRPRRSKQTEVLYGPVETGELAVVLSDLARVNGAMLGRWLVIRRLRPALHRLPPAQRLTLFDIGCGNGHLLRFVRPWAHN